MPLVVAIAEIPANRVNVPGKNLPGSPGALNTTFFRATKDTTDGPTAALNRYQGERLSNAHFHEVDQFQIRRVPARAPRAAGQRDRKGRVAAIIFIFMGALQCALP